MKFSKKVSASKRKNRKRNFSSDSNKRRGLMSATLSDILRKNYKIRSIPIRKDDFVRIIRGDKKGQSGKVIQCRRRNFKVLIEKITNHTKNNLNAFIPLSPSNLVIEKLSMTNDRKLFIYQKKKPKK
mmetsp:Transcript_1103/g.2417  ORF Transcript_1103/g.2417 Transcript_1103/m.2417 type:complete len:127 (+) Transcript_1103:1498-1878(+)